LPLAISTVFLSRVNAEATDMRDTLLAEGPGALQAVRPRFSADPYIANERAGPSFIQQFRAVFRGEFFGLLAALF
jgi:hypothetical protein